MTNQPLEVAALPTIDLYKILLGDATEQQRLFEAAQLPGIFYLDFSKYDLVMNALDEVYALSDRYFTQSTEQKEKDARMDQLPSQDRGYKKSENDETYEMADDELLRGNTLQLPDAIADKRKLIKDLSEGCHVATMSMLGSLLQSLKRASVDFDRRLESHQNPSLSSDSGLKLICEPTIAHAADVVENKHTDSGIFTVLFYTEWGLHVFLPSESPTAAAGATQEEGGEQRSGRWAYAAPKPNCALVNVADSLQRLSGGLFHSPLHRVTQHEDGEGKRYYLSYFLRPAHKLKEEWAKEDAATTAGNVIQVEA